MGSSHRHERRPTASNAVAEQLRNMSTTTASVPPADGAFHLGYVLILTIGTFCCFGLSLFAQISGSQSTQELPKQWQSTTDLKSDNLIPERIPVRIIESHSQNGNRTLDKRSVEIRGTDGHFEPYQDIERETLTVDASTVRTTMRTDRKSVV